MLKIGTREQVLNGYAKQTKGGYKKNNLKYNTSGNIVIIKKKVF